MLPRKRKFDQTSENVPNFAILKLRSDTDCVQLLQHALSLGIVDISFVSHPREYFSACEVPNLPKQAAEPPILQKEPSIVSQISNQRFSLPTTPMTIDEVQVKSESPEISIVDHPPAELEPDRINSAISSLFGRKEERPNPLTISHAPPRSDSPSPMIPGTGQILCKLCGISVSCRKITNLTLHTLRLHCPTPLWKCSVEECEFTHADFGRVRSHIRHQHSSFEGVPRDNRHEESVREAKKYLQHCYPSVDWQHEHQNAILITEPILEKAKSKFVFQKKSGESSELTTCSVCGTTVSISPEAVLDHIRLVHSLTPYSFCSYCEYENPDEWKVRMHASQSHATRPATRPLNQGIAQAKPSLFIPTFFPQLVTQMKNLIPPIALDTMLKENGKTASGSQSPKISNIVEKLITKTDGKPTSSVVMNKAIPPVSQQIEADRANKMNRLEKAKGKVVCEQCGVEVEPKRTQLVSHAKSHVASRQWKCPHCDTSAAFHSKLKLHIMNSHKSQTEPIDQYCAALENAWLLSFRSSFSSYAEQCYVEDWKFRSKQQQMYASIGDEEWMRKNAQEGAPTPRRSILVEEKTTLEDFVKKENNYFS